MADKKHIKKSYKFIATWLLNILCFIVDIVLFLTFLMLVVITLVLFVAVIAKACNRCPKLLEFINNIAHSKCVTMNDLIAALGVFATISVIPFLSLLVSVYISNSSNKRNISEALAKSKKIHLYLISLPLGIWGNLLNDYKRKIELAYLTPLAFYDYCLYLVFTGDYFQSYEISVRDVGYIDSQGKQCKIRSVDNFKVIPFLTSDNSGVEYEVDGELRSGTNISLLLKENDLFYNGLIDPKEINKNIYFEIGFKERKTDILLKIKNAFNIVSGYTFFFPIFRSIFSYFSNHHNRLIFYKIEIRMNSDLKAVNKEETKFEYIINDIDIEKIRVAPRKEKDKCKQVKK